MDFGDLLEEWEKLSAKPGGLDRAREAERRALEDEARRSAQRKAEAARQSRERAKARYSLESWLDEHGVVDKDEGRAEGAGEGRKDPHEGELRRLRDKRPEARLDLHGLSQAEAESALEAFLENSARAGLEKILVVTGKGNHSKEGPVLGKAARRVLEASPWAGRFGTAGPADGGTGALWVLVRRGAYFSR